MRLKGLSKERWFCMRAFGLFENTVESSAAKVRATYRIPDVIRGID